jgi:hypothetical protein
MKIGLIIQGPVISGGFTGQTQGFGRTRATKELLVNYNCESLINNNISNAKKLFDEVVVCTWKNQLPTLNDSSVGLLLLDDPTPDPPVSRKAIKEFPDFNKRNNIRQFYSVLEGAKYLKSKGITHAIKIRTDQGFNFNVLNEEFRDFISNSQKRFFVSFLNKNYPWVIPDFILGAEIDQLIKIAHYMCNSKKQFHENVHRDLFFKAFFEQDLLYRNFNFYDFFIFEDKSNRDLNEIINFSLNHIWQPASKKLYESMIWRGDIMKIDNGMRLFSTNGTENFLEMVNFSVTKSINWDQFMIYTLGSRSITSFIFKVNKFRIYKFFRRIRSELSYFVRKYFISSSR